MISLFIIIISFISNRSIVERNNYTNSSIKRIISFSYIISSGNILLKSTSNRGFPTMHTLLKNIITINISNSDFTNSITTTENNIIYTNGVS